MTARPDDGPRWATASRWRTTDRQWSATIQYSCFATAPTVIEVADEAALAEAIGPMQYTVSGDTLFPRTPEGARRAEMATGYSMTIGVDTYLLRER